MIGALGVALVVYGLLSNAEPGFRIAVITLGALLALAGVALPRVTGEIALDARGFKANMQRIDQVDPSALAAAVTEAAERTIPDTYPEKAHVVRELASTAVEAWGNPDGLAGRWWAQLAAFSGEPPKIDVVELRVDGEDLTAEIRRAAPRDQTNRRWQFVGKVRGSVIFGMFFTVTPDVNALSYGTIQLRRDDPAATKWSGFYVRLDIQPDGSGWSPKLEPIAISWQRSEPVYNPG